MAKAKTNAPTPAINETDLKLRLFNVQVQLKMAGLSKRLNSRAGLPGWLVDKEINSLITSATQLGLIGSNEDVQASLAQLTQIANIMSSSQGS